MSNATTTMRLLSLAIVAAVLCPSDGAVGVYDIGNVRPEGIFVLPDGAVDTMGLEGEGIFALVSEFYYGGIKAVNLDTGDVTQIVNSTAFGERGTIGLWYDDGLILACAGGEFVGPNNTAALNVFDAVTGELLAECAPEVEGKFMNDVTVINGLAYATDSFQNHIMVLELESVKTSGSCVVDSIETPEEIFLSEDVWSANGIVPFADGLLIAHETGGGVYYLDISDGNKVSEIIPNGTLPFADGLCIDGDTLYVAQNPEVGPVTGWFVVRSDDGVEAFKLGALESPDFDSPAACGISGQNIYMPNARFGLGLPAEGEDDLSTFGETFHVVGVDRFDFAASGSETTPTASPPTGGGNTTDPTTSAATALWNPVAVLSLTLFGLAFT